MSISNCDEDRLRIASKAQAQFDEARQLAIRDEHEKALECYLFAFDNGHYVDAWGGVRLSFIPGEIALLGKKYPQALEALKLRRDAREKLILEGETDYDVLSEWNALNRYLGEKMREFDVLEQLRNSGILDPQVEQQITRFNFEFLLESGRYDLLAEELQTQGKFFLLSIAEYETLLLFPEHRHRTKGKELYWLDIERSRLMDKGIVVFHLALGLKKELVANAVMKRILEFSDKSIAYEKLIRVSITTNEFVKALDILQEGSSFLSSEQSKELDDLIVARHCAKLLDDDDAE